MARTKTKERASTKVDVEMGATGAPNPPSKLAVALLGTCVVAALWAVMMLIPAGRVAYVYIFSYAEFYMGVVTLVSLSITIMVGLVSTDRLVLTIRQRLLLQSTHRTTGVLAITALGVHVWTKFAEAHVRLIDIFIPFLAPYNALFIGMGTVSAWIMVLVMWTGIARARFIGRGKPWMWRGIHSISYLMWPIALLHGLNAGRPAAVWVTVSYVVCVLLVLIGLAVRIAVSLNRRKDFASPQGTAGGTAGGMKPVGKMASGAAASLGGKGRGRARGGRDDALVSDRDNAVQAWKPAAPKAPATPPAPVVAEPAELPVPPVPAAAPVADEREDTQTRMRRPRPADDGYAEDERYDTQTRMRRSDFVDPPTQQWDLEDDEVPAPRRPRRRPEEDRPAPRQRRATDDEFDEPTGALSRRALEEGLRRFEDEDEVPAPRRRRDPADDDRADTGTRMRRRDLVDRELVDDDERMDTQTRMRRPARYADEEDLPVPRSRRAPAEEEDLPAPRSRRAAAPDDERYDTGTRMRRRDLVEDDDRADTGTRMRRRDLADRELVDDDERMDTQTRMRRPARYADEEPPAPRPRRYAEDGYAEDERLDTQTRMRRPARYADDEPVRPSRAGRYADEDDDAPRPRRGGGDVDRADSGRHSRSEFVDLAASADDEDDDTPTLVDMAQRRARRAEQQEPARTGTGRGARRGPGPRAAEEADDAGYWAQLRGEAQ